MGKPLLVLSREIPRVSEGSEPAEGKHLSTQRKRKQAPHLRGNIPLVAASEKGRAQTPPKISGKRSESFDPGILGRGCKAERPRIHTGQSATIYNG